MHSSLPAKLDSSFYYFLITPDEENESIPIYQGHTVPSLALSRLVKAVMHLPPTLHSHQHAPETLAKFRLCSAHQLRCAPLMVGELSKLPFETVLPIRVFLSAADTDEETARHLAHVNHPLLHIRSSAINRIFAEPRFGVKLLREHAGRVAEFIKGESPLLAAEILSMTTEAVAVAEPRRFGHSKYYHNVTIPNEIPLELSGGRFSGRKHFNTLEDAGYAEAIRRTALFMKEQRERLHKTFPKAFSRQTTELIITCPGMLHHLGSSGNLRKLRSPEDKPEDFMKAFLFWTKQEGYATLVDPETVVLLATNPLYQFFSRRWQEEIEAYTTAPTFQSFNEFCPVVRLPRKLNRCRGTIAMLGNHLRDMAKPSLKGVNRLTNRICTEMELVASGLLEGFLDGNNRSIRIVADLPLGWIRAGGIPLALRHYVSQLPTVPGALFMAQSLITERRYFNIGIRQNVVVIRSFSASDPLRHVLENSIKEFETQEGWDFDVEFIDVNDEEEFIAACGRLASPFLIFDGHGSHRKESQIGAIRIGDVDLDVWQLRGRVRIPPIVMLSCCDASPTDRSHATTANGFLALGARSVFAPMFPVFGVPSALMVARLLYRITTVSRAWTKSHKLPLSWVQIATAQIRACYTTDLLLQLVKGRLLDEEVSRDLANRATHLINCLDPEWYQFLRTAIAASVGWSSDQFDSYIEKSYTIPQALHYLQLGFPDKVLFCTDNFISKGQSSVSTES
jgi:hypothetical protein